MVRHVVEDEVVAVPVLGEVLTRVIDDVVGADRAHHLHVLRAAYAGHLGAERFGDLDGERPDASGRAVDQYLLTWLYLSLLAKKLECGGCGHPDGRGLLEREVGRLRHEVVGRPGRVLGEGPRAPAEDLIARLEVGHAAS